jgi:hypothetical protein
MALPFMKIINVGIAYTSNLIANPWLSSTFNLPNDTLSPYFFANLSNMGSINWHGPHQVAQKSTKTGLLPLTISSKFVSESSIKAWLPLACALEAFFSTLMFSMN